MPLTDLTLDTNVYLHSCNAIEARHAQSVERVRKQGYAFAIDERADGASAVAAPIRNSGAAGAAIQAFDSRRDNLNLERWGKF